MSPTANLGAWIDRQSGHAAAAMARAISATGLARRREAFGQVVVPARGSVLASPASADWDPEPDYFFHWVRDSAVVMRAVAGLMQDAADARERARWRRHFKDFVAFSLALGRLDGAALLAQGRHRRATRRGYRRFLRADAQLRRLSGQRLLGEPRFNPDGSLDILRWSRPQFDGPALRALACLRYLEGGGAADEALLQLLRQDLAFTCRHAGRRCIGPWEEAGENAHHYYVALVQLGALVHGRPHAGLPDRTLDAAERRLRAGLDAHWSPRQRVYRAIRESEGRCAAELVDSAVLLSVLDADLPDGPHSAQDPRVEATLAALQRLFARRLPLNRRLPAGCAPALGRSAGDRYFGGGAWYVTTLAAAALHYRLARLPGQERGERLRRGDAFMATVRALMPPDGSMSEQVDRTTGEPRSARHLTWSYAAFVETARLRRLALGGR